jgi:hypothetical protein
LLTFWVKDTAKTAVQIAIRGWEMLGYFLEGLIRNKEESDELEIIHKSLAGIESYRPGQGIFTKENLSSAGKKGAKKSRELGKGCTFLDSDELIAAGRKSALQRGHVLYSDCEKNRAYELSQCHHYRHQKGRNIGLPKVTEISKMLNKEFHGGMEIRSKDSVSALLSKLA